MQTSALPVKAINDSTIQSEPIPKIQYQQKEAYSSDTSGEETTLSAKNKVIFLDKISKIRKSHLKEHELQWWLGRVTEIDDNSFSAILEDLNGVTNIVEFDSEVVSQNEKELLFIGSIFTYTVSVVDNLFGGREYRTKIAFASKRTWVEEYERKAEKLIEEIFPDQLLNL